MIRTGAHVSVAKGLVAALEKAENMGANTMQVFTSPPQSYMGSKFKGPDCLIFIQKAKELDIQPIFIHATYLINLASDNDRLRQLSVESLIDDLTIADKIGAVGSIVHTGSHKGRGFDQTVPVVVDSIKQVMVNTPANTKLMLEIASGGKGKIGSSFGELATLLCKIGSPRLGVCLDTAHMFAGGLAFDTPEAVEKLSQQIDQTVTWDKVWCMHVNDSKVEFGSFRDRHENLGQGKIGLAALKILLNHEKFRQLPLILETPGFDGKGLDMKNLEILKKLFK